MGFQAGFGCPRITVPTVLELCGGEAMSLQLHGCNYGLWFPIPGIYPQFTNFCKNVLPFRIFFFLSDASYIRLGGPDLL